MKIDLINQENSTVKSIDISDSIFKTEINDGLIHELVTAYSCLLYTSPSPRDRTRSRMPSSA